MVLYDAAQCRKLILNESGAYEHLFGQQCRTLMQERCQNLMSWQMSEAGREAKK
jgi:hypothetical protein